MKKKFSKLICFLFIFLLVGVLNTSAKELSTIEANSYVIGTHEFSKEMLLSIKRIMLAARTIVGEDISEDDMVIYYKDPYGTWVDAMTAEVIPPEDLPPVGTGFKIEYEDLVQTLLAGPAAPTGISKTNATGAGLNDGTLIGVSDGQEYQLNETGAWIAITGTSVTGLAPGSYKVRVAETATHNAGEITEAFLIVLEVIAIRTASVGISSGSVIFTYVFKDIEDNEVDYAAGQAAPYYLDINQSTVTLTNLNEESDPVTLQSLGISSDGSKIYEDLFQVNSDFGVLGFTSPPTQVVMNLIGATSVNGGNDEWEEEITIALDQTEIGLLMPADMTAYGLILSEVGALVEDDYTTESWGLFETAIAGCNLTLTSFNLQTAIDAEVTNIQTAQSSLAPEVGDLTNYNLALAAVVEANYTAESWTTYQLVVSANTVTEDNLQSVIDAATSAITTAQSSLAPEVGNLTNYNLALAAVVEANYTAASWTTYQLVVSANTVTEDNLQSVIDAATSAITTAQNDLVLVFVANDLAGLKAAITAAGTNATEIVLGDNISIPTTSDLLTIPSGADITLNMNGKTVSTIDGVVGRPITNKGTLIVTGNGTIDSSAAGVNGHGAIKNEGTLTIENGTFTGSLLVMGTSIRNQIGATLTINGGTFNGSPISLHNEGTATINGGTFKTDCTDAGSKQAYAIQSLGTLTFNNGTVEGVYGGLAIVKGTATVTGGDFKIVAATYPIVNYYALYVAGAEGPVDVTISGGTFESADKVAAYLGNDAITGLDPDGGIGAETIVSISGGTFKGATEQNAIYKANICDLTLTGGAFNSDVVALLGLGSTHIATNDPDTGLWTVTLISDTDLVAAAKILIEAGSYLIPYANQTDQVAKTLWVQDSVTALVTNGVTAMVTWNEETSKYDVALSKGIVNDIATITVIEAQLSDTDLVAADKILIEAGTYIIPFGNQGDQATKTLWVQTAVEELIVNGSTATVTWNQETSKYDVALSKGDVNDIAIITVLEAQ